MREKKFRWDKEIMKIPMGHLTKDELRRVIEISDSPLIKWCADIFIRFLNDHPEMSTFSG